jgi:hypothetical protein
VYDQLSNAGLSTNPGGQHGGHLSANPGGQHGGHLSASPGGQHGGHLSANPGGQHGGHLSASPGGQHGGHLSANPGGQQQFVANATPLIAKRISSESPMTKANFLIFYTSLTNYWLINSNANKHLTYITFLIDIFIIYCGIIDYIKTEVISFNSRINVVFEKLFITFVKYFRALAFKRNSVQFVPHCTMIFKNCSSEGIVTKKS